MVESTMNPNSTASSEEATRKSHPPSNSLHAQQEIQPSTLPLNLTEDRLFYLRGCVAPHVESFDFAIEEGLELLSKELEPIIFRGPKGTDGSSTLIALRAHSFSVQKPRVNLTGSARAPVMRPLYPSECRRTGASYQGELYGAFTIILNNENAIEVPTHKLGRIPIMVGSVACHLREKARHELIALGEEEFEVGGTFIANGSEKVMRLLVVPRSNHPIAVRRDRNAMRGPLFTDLSLSFRSMRRDLTTQTMHFHFMRSGSVRARVSISRREYFIPIGILLRAFLPSGMTDREIFEFIIGGDLENIALCNSAIAIIRELSDRYPDLKRKEAEDGMLPSTSRKAAIAYIGNRFRVEVGLDDEAVSDFDAGTTFLRKHILVHLSVGSFDDTDDSLDRSKADLLVFLVQKLVATSSGEVEVDNADSLSHQALMPPGQIYLALLKEKIGTLLKMVASNVNREATKNALETSSHGEALQTLIMESLTKAIRADIISTHMAYLLSTGNLKTDEGLDLPQTVGYSVMAERINYFRFIAHFRAVHRGAFYAQMRSTQVRKLLPEAWGFICPVHTPDGDPCGILNHLASEAIITKGSITDRRDIVEFFSDFNLIPAFALSAIQTSSGKETIPIVADGRVLGHVFESSAADLANQIRYSKIRSRVLVLPNTAEVVYVPRVEGKSGFMPGIYVFTGAGRVMRPVKWLHTINRKPKRSSDVTTTGLDEWIGSLEQVFLRVRPAFDNPESCLNPIDMKGATHAEISSVSFISVLASLIPFADMNQGPRNMFQCQMAKQTMGTPCHTVWNRMESKIYRHTMPQVPITRNFCMQDPMGADLFPNGVNAVVAVISYSGNDMEDALIINKASLERGFAHGSIYVNEKVDLDDSIVGRETNFVERTTEEMNATPTVDEDGLPAVGARVKTGSPLYGITSPNISAGRSAVQWKKYKSVEDGTIDEVTVYDSDMYRNARKPRGKGIREANVRIRVSRRPVVGDKFASRAGQKGTMSAAWPSEDMPFSESGMTPDILFNPNGFPSRMTIGMMVEIMSGKAGALHGNFNDSTPFQFDEKHRAVDFFAKQLVAAGYDYAGSETLYSGYTGEPFEVNIFTGIVHYQRLRHMVSDKFQVRTTGAVNPLFRQPVKGRKKGGAIRFGEMERDGLLAHGASFLLRDRLALASDMHIVHACRKCGSLLTPMRTKETKDQDTLRCRMCEPEKKLGFVEKIALPYSFKYLANELAAMNIRTVLSLKEVS